jgi:hypothetical protein
MRLVHGLVRQHGLSDDVTDGKDVGHIGAHMDVDINEAAAGHGHARFVGGNLFAIERAAYGLKNQSLGFRFDTL